MSSRDERPLERSHRELDAARVLAVNDFGPQAISRAYYAALFAAESALAALGETRSKHAGVVAGFGQLIVKQHGFDPDEAALLRSLFRRRSEADYGAAPASRAEAEGAIADAERFVAAVEAWLHQHER